MTLPMLNRRRFIAASLMASGGIAFEFALPLGASAQDAPGGQDAPTIVTAFVRIMPDNRAVISAKNAEIGQGAKTSLPMMIAEELDLDWDAVTVEQVRADAKLYGAQSAGGSRTTAREWLPMRQAGAAARAMFVAAAAQQWGVSADALTTASGKVLHTASNRSATYAELASMAAQQTPPALDTLKLKDPAAFRIVGKPVKGVDTPAITQGKPLFGIDVVRPGMLHAVLETCPAVRGRFKSANLDEIRAMPGIEHVFVIEGDGEAESLLDGVAVLSKSWWSADRARQALQVEWDTSAVEGFSTDGYVAQATAALDGKAQGELLRRGDVEGTFASAAKTVSARYEMPFLAHGTLEPQNTTALFTGDAIEIWAPTQNPEPGRSLVAKALGLPEDRIRINLTRTGGGFGRRLMNDYMVQAAAIAAKVPGVPVKLLYNRQDEFRRDFFRPASWHAMEAALDAKGTLLGFKSHAVSFGINGEATRGSPLVADILPATLLDVALVEQTMLESNMPTGWLRAPRSNNLGFVLQCFLDEVALAAGKDLPGLMLELLKTEAREEGGREGGFKSARARGVIEKVIAMADWSARGSLGEGRGKGFGFFYSHAGYFAEVVEVVVADGMVRVPRVWAAGDVGSQIVNPLNAEQQVRGSIIEGLGQALAGQKITQVAGAVEQANYDTHPFMRIDAVPEIELEFVLTDNPPTGLGEPALPPVLGALGNAIFAATGKRLRSLPVDLSAEA